MVQGCSFGHGTETKAIHDVIVVKTCLDEIYLFLAHQVGGSSCNDDQSTIQPTFVTGGSLRPYQLQGLAWLKVQYYMYFFFKNMVLFFMMLL